MVERYKSQEQQPARILRPAEAQKRLGVRRTAFMENFVRTGKLKKIAITSRATGYLESDVEALIAELAAQ